MKHKLRKCIVFIIIFILSFSCVSLSEKGKSVRAVAKKELFKELEKEGYAFDPYAVMPVFSVDKSCNHIGSVRAKNMPKLKMATIILRNKTAEEGGNLVLIEYVATEIVTTVHGGGGVTRQTYFKSKGQAYYCDILPEAPEKKPEKDKKKTAVTFYPGGLLMGQISGEFQRAWYTGSVVIGGKVFYYNNDTKEELTGEEWQNRITGFGADISYRWPINSTEPDIEGFYIAPVFSLMMYSATVDTGIWNSPERLTGSFLDIGIGFDLGIQFLIKNFIMLNFNTGVSYIFGGQSFLTDSTGEKIALDSILLPGKFGIAWRGIGAGIGMAF